MIHQVCPECGIANETGARRCPECGASTVVTVNSVPDEVSESDYSSVDNNLSKIFYVKYDPRIIGTFAEALYSRANWIVFIWTVIGGLGGALVLGLYLAKVGALIGLAVGGLMGFFEGQSRSFLLRLQAQLALCAVQIEINTRHEHKKGTRDGLA